MYEYKDFEGEQVCEFSYSTEDLLERVKMETAYMAITIKTQDGVPLVDDYAVTQDEEDIITAYLKDVARELANRDFAKLCRKPYEYDGNEFCFRAGAVPEAEGREQPVDDDVVNFLMAGAVLKWCELKQLANQIQIYAKRKQESMQSLHKSLFEFRL